MSDCDYKSDDQYNAGIFLTEQKARKMYAGLGIDYNTGLPIKSIHQMKQEARACGCISCAGVLANIRATVAWHAISKTAADRRRSRTNYNYFIDLLRVIRGSCKHNH